MGWNQNNLNAYLLTGEYSTYVAPILGDYYIRIPFDGTDDGNLEMVVDTGRDLYNRTFTFAYSASSLQADATTCNISFAIGDADGDEVETVTQFTNNDGDTIDSYTSDWEYYYYTYTFPDEDNYGGDGDAGSKIKLIISEDAACDVDIDGAQLLETDSFGEEFVGYASSNLTYLNGDTISCEPEDVGCELYVQSGKDEKDGIPGIITNPESESCLGTCSNLAYSDEINCLGAGETWDATAYNYGNPQCSQCNGNPDEDQSDDFYKGCGFYQEVSLENNIPLTTEEAFLVNGSDEWNGVVQRYGGRCSDDNSEHCFQDNDCTGYADGATCELQLSVVPSSADRCSVSQVGCEEYTNLDAVSAGGEGLSYYTQLKQCVKTNDASIYTFHTIESSDVTGGIEIVDHLLKLDSDGGPCTSLDLESEDYNADCNSTPSADECGPAGDDVYGDDPDCRQYVNDAGDVFYRYESQVVVASESCLPLRNSQDTRVYYAIPGESTSCSASAVSCREYRGTSAADEYEVFKEAFRSNTTEGWDGATSTSNDSLFSGDYSLEMHDSSGTEFNVDISHDLFEEDSEGVVNGDLTGGNSYILTFWAKADTAGTAIFWIEGTGTDYYFTTDGSVLNSPSDASVTLDPNSEGGWQFYQLGPVILDELEDFDLNTVKFVMNFTGAGAADEAVIDSMILTESNSQYLIQDTFEYCQEFEGCREYKDRDNTKHYLKSFTRLCNDDVVGCEAMIDTQNSSHPFTEAYNLDNEYDEDDVIVHADEAVTLVYDEDNECSELVYGCSAVGLPDVDEQSGAVNEFSTKYFLDRPDSYSSILCEQPQLSCREYKSNYDGTVYFKDPGERICVLNEYTNEVGNLVTGWFKDNSTSDVPDCPKQFDYADPSQPLGGVCNSNSIYTASDACSVAGNNNESDCTADAGIWDESKVDNRVGKLCNQDGDCYPTGWSSGDPIPRCISNLDDDVDVRNGQVHQYEIYPEDDVHLASVVNDIGWVGQCKSATSGCSEYVDPYSPNIVEANKNWSFENDVRNTSNVYYDETDTPDGFPDWWVINYNATEVDTGLLDTEGDPIYANTEIDIEGDGSIDFTTTCDTTKAVQTDSSAYTGDSISPSDGASAVSLSDCILENKEFEVIERDKLYSIRVMVKLDEASFEDTEFSIGLRFYDSEGYELRSDTGDVTANQVFVVADHELMSSVASYEADAYDGKSTWYRWQSNIGLGSTVEFPENAYYARMFIANHGTSPMYFDEASFKQNDKYYYLDYTVDGTTEKEQTDSTNSCYDQDTEESSITSDGGCVSFRDVTYDTQNYSQDGLDCTNCLLTPNSDSCRGVVDACDTNTILKVKKDRVCDKWLGCITAEIVIDENGNQDVQCFELSECLALDENGQCKTWNWKVNYDDLNATHDLFYSSAPGDTDSLEAVRNLTGYVKAGMTWASNRTCEVGSPQAGQTCNENSDCYETLGRCKEFSCIGNPMTACSTDEDCIVDSSFQCQDPLRVEGYYPYGWMYEVGENGAENGKELIEYSTFEQLYCDGQQADRSVACILNASSSDYGHCYTSSMQSKIDSSDTVSVEDVLYQDDSGVGSDFNDNDADQITLAFCPNSPNFGDYWPFGIEAEYTQTGWQAMRNGDMFVSQFDTNLDCDTEACESIDVNNVLQFRADLDSGIPFSGGAEYSLSDSITPNGSYALSFDARFADTSWIVQGEDISNPTTMTICFDHTGIKDGTGTELDRKDCFVNGYGSADIVFAIDTSASMGAEITAIQQAAPALAYLLDQQGVDTRFALVDMDDRDNTSNNDEDANYIDLDFTSSICDSYNPTTNICTGGTFNNAIKALKADNATVDPFNAVYESAINSFTFGTTGSERNLDFRADTKPFVIVVTDTYDENTRAPLSGWDIGESEASAATQEVDMPAFIITDDNSVSYYSQLAGASDGQVYSYMDPDTGVTISDWANNTTIISDITANIIAGVDIFQLSNSMDHYSFGPITAEKLYIGDADEDGADADQSTSVRTNLQFLMTDGSPVQLDNISLLPVLETNKDLTPIGRTCRAYPTNDARQCVYSETNGVSYSGWKGYCLETDPDDKRRCITWYPLEAIQGETSIVTRTTAGYTGRSEVYHCMVSKGYEELGICDAYSFGSAVTFNANQEFGQGVLCTEDNDASCGSNSCMIGAFYDLPEDTDYQNNDEHNDISDGYTEQAFTNGIYTVYDDDIPYVVEPMRWQLHDPFDSAEFEWSQNGATPAYDNGIVTRIPANELMRNIHVSEIEGLVLNTGSAGDGAGDGGNSHLEYPYWGQLGFHGEIDKSGSPYDVNESYPAVTDVPEECSAFADAGVLCDEFGNWLLTDLDGGKHGGSIYNDGTDYKPWYNCAVYDESDAPGIGCRVWGTWDSEFLQKYYDDEKGDVTGMNPDLVYVWAWSNFDHGYGSGDSDSMTYDCGTGTNNREDEQRDAYKFGTLKDKPEWWFKSKCLASTIDYVIGMNSADTSNIEEWAADNDNKARNPWKHLEDSFLSTIVDEDVDNEFPKVVHFEGSETGTSDVKSWGGWQNYEDTYAARSGGGENTVNGGNIFSVWIDFNDEGYIQAVYTMVYHGAIDTEDSHVGYNRGVELTWDNSLSMKIHLRESCSLIAEAVDSRGNQVAWAARADGSDTYDMHAADDSSTFDFNYSVDSTPYGSITPQDDGPTFWDSQETGGGDEALLYEHGSFGVTPVLSYDTSELNAGHPIACIGECSTKYCSGNPTKEGVVCTDDDDCGSMGSCVGIQADNIITGNGMDTTYSNFDDQLEAVADIATLKLKHIWADILGNYYKLTFGNSCSNRSYRTESSCILNGNTWDTWLETTRSPYEDVGGDYYGTAFEDMSACNGDGTERPGESQGEEAEYCGVYPYLENISVDGNSSIADGYYDIENGRTVQLQFTTSVDQNQLPLDYIYIDWGDGDDAFSRWEASPTTHIYTHAYNCDPGNTYDLEPENQTSCTYLPKITVVDHWDWCSGSDETTDPPTSGTRNRHSGSESDQNLKTSCGTYDPVEFNIRVDATS
ncbi:MAG: vWA domain-containing protein [bacterium]|nr:vWA domain-containing protein [bacterium]